MNASLQEAIQEAYASAPTNLVTLHTLEIRQDGVQDTIFLARSRQGFTAKDENGVSCYFQPSGFQFSLPPSNEDGFQSLNIAIDNIGRKVSDFLKNAISEEVAVKVLYRPYLSDDLSRPQMQG